MIFRIGMQGPHLGYNVQPSTVTAMGTSSVHGKAAEHTAQQHCAWRLQSPLPSQVGPQHIHGKHGAPVLQQTSAFKQKRPTLPLHKPQL